MTIMRGYHGRLSGGGLGVISYILNASKYKCYFFFSIYTRVKYMAIWTYLRLFVTKRFQDEEECLLNVFSPKYVASRAGCYGSRKILF